MATAQNHAEFGEIHIRRFLTRSISFFTISVMERTFTYTITEKDAGKDIRTFLRGEGYSRHILASIKPDPDAVLLNGSHVYLRQILQEQDVLTIRVRDEENSRNVVPAPVPFSVAYEDEDILVIDKPARVAIHPAISHPANTLANGVAWYYEQQGIPFVFRCINRLDRDTTGLLIVAKNLVSASILETALQRREIRRTYLAVAEGLLPDEGTIDLPIARKEGSLIERCVDPERGERAVTHFRRVEFRRNPPDSFPPSDPLPLSARAAALSSDSPSQSLSAGLASSLRSETRLADFVSEIQSSYSVAEVHLETGRTHQIRVHMAATGHPLLGDSLYNPSVIPLFDKEVPKPGVPLPYGLARQALHSWKLDFTHPITKEPMHFEAPVPEDMLIFL